MPSEPCLDLMWCARPACFKAWAPDLLSCLGGARAEATHTLFPSLFPTASCFQDASPGRLSNMISMWLGTSAGLHLHTTSQIVSMYAARLTAMATNISLSFDIAAAGISTHRMHWRAYMCVHRSCKESCVLPKGKQLCSVHCTSNTS